MSDVLNHQPDCLFCKIIRGEIPSNKVYEDDLCYAFTTSTPGAHPFPGDPQGPHPLLRGDHPGERRCGGSLL